MDTNMSRRDLLKFGAVATTAAVGVSMLGCSTNSAAADGAADATKAATGTASVTMEEATSQNILNVEKTVPNFAYIPDIDYKQTITKNSYSTMKMDIIAPSSDKPLPCILYINGGGFTRSSPAGHLWERMYLAEQGFVVASIQHSVVPAAKFPQPLLDCKDAVRFLRANAATYNIDKDRIAAMGNSAGGYFATMLGVTADIAKFNEGVRRERSRRLLRRVRPHHHRRRAAGRLGRGPRFPCDHRGAHDQRYRVRRQQGRIGLRHA